MTDDLTTLLRDVGREPSIELDAASVHAAGRRRAVTARVATGGGALVLAAALAIGLPQLLDGPRPDGPIVDEVPTPGPTPSAVPTPAPTGDDVPTESPVGLDAPCDEPDGPAAACTDRGLAAATGLDVVRLAPDDPFTGFDVTRTAPEGGITVPPRWTERAVQLGTPRVTDDGAAWAMTPEGDTVRWTADDGSAARVVRAATDGLGWLPVGTVGDRVVVAGTVLAAEVSDDGGPPLRLLDADGELVALPGVDLTAGLLAEELPYEAAVDGELLAVVAGVGESTRAVAFPAGEAPVELVVGDDDARPVDVTVADGTAYVLEAVDGGAATRLRVVPVAAGGAARVVDVDPGLGRPVAITSGPAGSGLVVLDRYDETDGTDSRWVLDVAALDGLDVLTADAVTALDGEGLVRLVPPAPATTELAACAGDPLNQPPPDDASTALWFLCWDAVGELPEGVAHPFVRVDRFGASSVAGPAAAVRFWADGPLDDEAARGLTGGLDPEVATVADVAVANGRLTLDLAPGPQVGVLGTTTGGATFVQSVAGVTLQWRGVDELVVTLDGSCEAWATLLETEGCPVYDASHAPWSQ